MRKLTKADSERKASLVDKLTASRAKAQTALDSYNAALKIEFAALQAAVDEYNEVVQEADGFRDDIANEIDDYMGNRSDKWQESDAASAYQEWHGEWDTSFDVLDIEQPENADLGDEGYEVAELLRDLQEEVPE